MLWTFCLILATILMVILLIIKPSLIKELNIMILPAIVIIAIILYIVFVTICFVAAIAMALIVLAIIPVTFRFIFNKIFRKNRKDNCKKSIHGSGSGSFQTPLSPNVSDGYHYDTSGKGCPPSWHNSGEKGGSLDI
jgi:glucan phosphoethanolaminetransferase (alkaline phosphatase superfamily)